MTTPPPSAPAPSAALGQLPQLLADGNLPQIHQLLDSGQLEMLGQYLTGEQMSAFQFSVHAGDIDATRASVAGVEVPGVGVLWPKKRSPWPIVAGVVVVLALLGVGAWFLFGGDDLETIADTLSSDSEYSKYSELLEQADLTSLLSEDGPFTVFAADNAAFEALPADQLQVLESDGVKLRAVLEYSIAGDEYRSEELPASIPTVEGQDLSVEGSGSSATVNGASIVKPDVEASNGLFQGIDAVLIPPGLDLTAPPSQNIVELLSANSDYSTFVGLLTTAGLSETLTSAGPFTVFAPQNSAFAALPPGELETLSGDPQLLRSVLNYHIVAGNYPTSELKTENLNSVEGSSLDIVVSGSSVRVNGNEVTAADLLASNGVVHGIGAVLVPPGLSLATTTTTSETTTTVPPTTEAPTTAAPTTTTTLATTSTSTP